MKKYLFGQIMKVEEQPDGTLHVEGIASSESRDSQKELVRASAMAKALPDYLKFPALREMHQPLAAGRTLAAFVNPDDGKTYITAKVVDKDAIDKVRHGVYNGFSIGGTIPPGGRNTDDPTIIEAINLCEISLVDRPANPEAVLTFYKAEVPADEGAMKTKEEQAAEETKKAAEAEEAKKAAEAKAAEEAKKAAETEEARKADEAKKAADAEAAKKAEEAKAAEEAKKAAEAEETKKAAEAEAVRKAAEEAAKAAQPDDSDLKQACMNFHKALAANGFCKDDDVGMAATVTDLRKRADEAEKVAGDAGEVLKKVLAERDALKADNTKLAKDNDDLRKRNEALEVEVKKKGALRSFDKADDGRGTKPNDGSATQEQPEVKKKDDLQAAAAELKKVHAVGGVRLP